MKNVIGFLAGAVLLAGCGGSPVATYLLNFDPYPTVTKGSGAQCPDADPSDTTRTSDVKGDAYVQLFQGEDANFYATFPTDDDGVIVAGTKTDATYNLTAAQTRDDRTTQNVETRSSTVYTVTMTTDGDFASGSIVKTVHTDCQGSGCGGTPTIECNYSTNFRGRLLPDDGALHGVPVAADN